MKNVTAILSMLHEPARDNSAARLFRDEPVLRWTLSRLSRTRQISDVAVLCWDDQVTAVSDAIEQMPALIMNQGERAELFQVAAITTARRWADGWRGGLLGTCHFDLGFHGPAHCRAAQTQNSGAIVLIDPSAGLVDPVLIDELIAHAHANASLELCFAPAAPGLGGMLLRTALVERLASAGGHPGRLLNYHPDQLSREPLAAESCAPVPTPVARTIHRFTLDSDRQVRRLSAAVESLNGQLLASSAEELVHRVQRGATPDPLPREIVLELNTNRSTSPIFWPGRTLNIRRPDICLDLIRRLFSELAAGSDRSAPILPSPSVLADGITRGASHVHDQGCLDDMRLTLSGVGDPLLFAGVFEVIDEAARRGICINVETDLNGVTPEQIRRLAATPVDVVSVHLPAVSANMYERVMGVDRYGAVLENVRLFLAERQLRRSAVPILAPVFTKCADNLGEMEAWYDQWLRAVGSAVIRAPSDFAAQVPDVAVADMSPAGRKPCVRLASRLTILSDGSVVSCEQDVLGRQVLGRIGQDTIADNWQRQMGSLRRDHRKGNWDKHPLCGACREWHRP